MSIIAAGILPYTYFQNQLYFLVGREHKEKGWTGSDKLSDFGGAVESEHKDISNLKKVNGTLSDYAKYTAAIEFWEETMGLFYSVQEIFNMLNQPTTIIYNNSNYAAHLIYVNYDPFWTEIFKNAYNYILSCAKPNESKIGYMYIPSCPKGFTEKTDIEWVSYNDLLVVFNDSSKLLKYRPEFIDTIKKIQSAGLLAPLVKNANVFIVPTSVEDIKLPTEPILIDVVTNIKTMPYYPIIGKPDYTDSSYIGTNIKTLYKYLFNKMWSSLELDPKLTNTFDYINQINQLHFDIKKFIYGKTNVSDFDKYWYNSDIIVPITDMAMTKYINYCPLSDKTILVTPLTSGAYGKVYSIKSNGSINIIAKTVNDAKVEQLDNIPLDYNNVAINITGKITNILATEIAAMSIVNNLAIKSICYNLPHFYGTYECKNNQIMYIYMQQLQHTFANILSQMNSNDWDSLLFQGIMTIMSLQLVNMTHGDINALNIGVNLHDTKRPLYRYKTNFYAGKPTNKIFYLIDYGMAFIKDKLEPISRIEKDQIRVDEGVNWTDTNIPYNKIMSGKSSALVYKGYYIKSTQVPYIKAADIRRVFLDIYLLSSMLINHNSSYEPIFTNILNIFANPFASAYKYSNINIMVKASMNDIIDNLVKLKHIELIEESQLSSLDLNKFTFLGNITPI